MSQAPLLCIAGGGTGGHVMPALALADAARRRWPDLQVRFIGAARGLEAKLLPERGESVLLLTMHAVKGTGLLQKLSVFFWELPKAVFTIRRSWRREQRPALLVGVGGYASAAGVLAAVLSHIPIVLNEQNAMPGLVNRKLSRYCSCVMLGFAGAAKHLGKDTPVAVTGNLVRREIAEVTWQRHNPPRLLVLGGSQGAWKLNETVPEACALLASEGRTVSVTHVAGRDETMQQEVRAAYEKAGVEAKVLAYCDDMAGFYASGDLMIARSGAMTVSEAAASGMPSLFVPLPHAADDHQRHNAEALAEAGGARVLNQREMTAANLAKEIDSCLFDGEQLEAMSRAAKSAAQPDTEEKQLQILAAYLSAGEVAS